ncbi:pancreatic secretory granule membrane major glycoprotein GP2-like [Pseudophryne corroboree]|uniref:pancreatic secretory granule membrane major glycoprotein GP2-like n=1 Tax=Pseudophryne corroboree TaxID=495146 RepID=UPI0030820461
MDPAMKVLELTSDNHPPNVWTRLHSDLHAWKTVTPTHAIYKNHIYLPVDPAAIIVREITVINVTCSYPLNLNTSTGAIRPDLRITYIPIDGSGTFKVRMAIYTDISYTTPNNNPVIDISTKSILYVGVFIEEPAANFNLLMINCYSTPTNNAYDPVRYNILVDRCPNPTDSTIKVLQNGVTSMGMFYLQAFKFIGDYSYVYLHCEVYLCKDSCAPTCSSRSSSEAPKAQGTLTYGPFRIDGSNGNSVGYYNVNNNNFLNVPCSDKETVIPSLTFVVDTTGSTSLSLLQEATRILINSISASSENVTRQYTLVEFNDPSVGPLRATCSTTDFVNYINLLYTSDGGDCPEYAMTGLLQALENIPYGSLVVLATDASAKDSSDSYTVNRIFSLLDSKQAKWDRCVCKLCIVHRDMCQ